MKALLCLSAAVTSNSYPTIVKAPQWSLDTLGGATFVHGGDSHTYNSTQLALISKFQMAQFDKKANIASMPNVPFEDRSIAASRLVKSEAPHIKTLLYINGMINFPGSRLFNLTDSSLLARNKKGEYTMIRGNTVFNSSDPKMRSLIVSTARYGMEGGFDGVFIDRADWAKRCSGSVRTWDNATCDSLVPGQRQLFVDLIAALGEDAVVLAKETSSVPMNDWQVTNAMMTSDTFCSQYCHNCSTSVDPKSRWTTADRDDCVESINTIASAAARGQLSQSHAMGPLDNQAAREFTMAAFLVAAGRLSYFSYANWIDQCWELTGTRWWPEYDLPLGDPTSPAAQRASPDKPYVFVRNFSSGTSVYVDVEKHEAKIIWATSARGGF